MLSKCFQELIACVWHWGLNEVGTGVEYIYKRHKIAYLIRSHDNFWHTQINKRKHLFLLGTSAFPLQQLFSFKHFHLLILVVVVCLCAFAAFTCSRTYSFYFIFYISQTHHCTSHCVLFTQNQHHTLVACIHAADTKRIRENYT